VFEVYIINGKCLSGGRIAYRNMERDRVPECFRNTDFRQKYQRLTFLIGHPRNVKTRTALGTSYFQRLISCDFVRVPKELL